MDDKGAFNEDVEEKGDFGTNGTVFKWSGEGWGELYWSVAEERAQIASKIGRRSINANLYPSGAYPIIFPNNGSDAAWCVCSARE